MWVIQRLLWPNTRPTYTTIVKILTEHYKYASLPPQLTLHLQYVVESSHLSVLPLYYAVKKILGSILVLKIFNQVFTRNWLWRFPKKGSLWTKAKVGLSIQLCWNYCFLKLKLFDYWIFSSDLIFYMCICLHMCIYIHI